MVPEPLAGANVERENAVAEQIGADTIGAVHIVGRRSQGKVGNAPLFIDGDLTPGVDAAYVLPGVRRPRVITELTGMRDSVKGPEQLAAEDVIGAQVSRSRAVPLAGL